MSVDPLASGAAADLTALVDAELAALAADAQALANLLEVGTVVQARVLPPNGLTDLLEIAGKRVAASLPPTVRPGDVLTVRVTGFENEQILVQVLPEETPPAEPPLAPAPSSGASPAAAAPPRPVSLGGYAAYSRPLDPLRPAVAATPQPSPPAVPAGPTSIEARLAASRATAIPGAATTSADPPRTAAASPPPQQRYVAPPPIVQKGSAPQPPLAPAAPTANSAPRPSGLSAYTQPVALLRALRLPVTPGNVASATLALERPDRLPQALATLERALPQGNADPQVATLRTLLGFVGRIAPDSPTLAAQVSAYIDQVVSGAEPKLATLLAAARAMDPPSERSTSSLASSVPVRATVPRNASAQTNQTVPRSAPPPPPPSIPTVPAALVAERTAALGADLKQTLLSVATNPATPETLAPSIAGALTALTAVQLQAAQLLATRGDAIVFAIPLATAAGTTNARIAIDREAPKRSGVPLDGENYRIAFVLDTAHYGTVAIDLVTVGREVTVDVRAETAPAMRAFRDALGGLTARLESLNYRVAAAQAGLGTTSTVAVETPPSTPADPNAIVDRSA